MFYSDSTLKTPAGDNIVGDEPNNKDRGNRLLRSTLQVLPLMALGALLEGCASSDTPAAAAGPALGSEANPFLATSEAETFVGGEGTDWLSFAGDTGTDAVGVVVNLSLPTAQVSEMGDFAHGDIYTGINNVIGTAGVDTLTGNANNNVFEGGGGADIIDGGAHATVGGDTASYRSSSAAVVIDLADDGATITLTSGGGDATGDMLTGIENLIGSAQGDTLTGNNVANVLEGLAGADVLAGAAGADTYVFNRGDSSATAQDTITDVVEAGVMNIVRFEDGGTAYDGVATTGTAANTLIFTKSGDDLVITANTDGAATTTETNVVITDYLNGSADNALFTIYASGREVTVNLNSAADDVATVALAAAAATG